MFLNVTFVGIIILLAILIPVLILVFASSGTIKKAKKTVARLSQSQGANPKDFEVIGNTIIGLDEASKKLVYSVIQNPEQNFKIIDLADLKECHARSKKHNDGILSWAGLELVNKPNSYEITFYDDDAEVGHSRDPQICLRDAKRWAETIRPLLK